MKAFKGIGSQLVLSFAVGVCVAIILVSLGSIRITKTSINANTEVTSEQTLDNVQEGFTTYRTEIFAAGVFSSDHPDFMLDQRMIHNFYF